MAKLSNDRHQLYVEGQDDKHAIRHLLIWHGFDHQEVQSLREDKGSSRGYSVPSLSPLELERGSRSVL